MKKKVFSETLSSIHHCFYELYRYRERERDVQVYRV